jgi:hypothetical protein
LLVKVCNGERVCCCEPAAEGRSGGGGGNGVSKEATFIYFVS